MDTTPETPNTDNPDQDAGPPGNGLPDGADDTGPHPDPPPPDAERDADAGATDERGSSVDERSAESFPGSDPPATWAGPDRPPR